MYRIQIDNRARRFAVAVAAGVVALTPVACGGGSEPDEEAEFAGAPLELQDPGPVHVHGLGYDRSTGTLFIATHTGLFELPGAASSATRIGDSRQDTMGFFLAESGRFLGSGHPDARAGLPPHLGLIESTDRGRSWQTVSLSGKADFHVLRARGAVVYGFDSSNERFLASADGGVTWAQRPVPESLVDLAIDPSDAQHLVASGQSGLYRSTDGGRSWAPAGGGVSGYLAWPAPQRLYVATLDGAFLTATSSRGPWRGRAQLAAPVSALHAAGAAELFAALHDGTILHSVDGGASWDVRATP